MKSLTQRIISSLLCAAITAVNVNVCGVAAVNDGDIAVSSGVRGVTPTVSATPRSSGSTGNAIFGERSQSILGSDSDSIAIKQADPYGTADSNGDGSKWATLAVIPEVYTMYNQTGTAIDYKGSSIAVSGGGGSEESPQISGSTLNTSAYMQVSAGLNLGNGKNDAVARLSYDVSTTDNQKHGTLYLEVCDPVNSGWKTDRNFNVIEQGWGTSTIHDKFTKSSLTDVIPPRGWTLSMSRYKDKFEISSFDSLVDRDQNVRGQYLSVATGDFDGNGKDSIIAYIPDFSEPQIKEYECVKTDITAFNLSEDGISWQFWYANNDYTHMPHYYQPTESKVISSNVYTTFGLTKTPNSTGWENESRNVPIVDIVAADVDRDGCDELIVTAGLGDTTQANNCNTVMKIYDFVDGQFSESYSVQLKNDSYNGQGGRIRWASSAVGNVQLGANGALGTDFPEIVTAGWVDGNTDAGISMKHRLGVHITGLVSLEKRNGTYVGTYAETLVTATSDQNLDSNHLDGVSVHMKDGFPAWTRHDRLAVGTLAYKGLESQSAIMLGDTVYDIISDNNGNRLSAAYWGKDIKDHTRYSVRKMLTGNYQVVDDLAGESVYFLCADRNNTYAAYMYYYKDGVWHTDRIGTDSCNQNSPAYDAAVDICDIDIDNDSLYIKLRDVVKTWADPKPLYVLEAAPYFSEFPDSKGSTGVGYSHESGYEVSWSASISAAVETYFSQDVSFIVKIGSWSTGIILEGSLTYEGSLTNSKSVNVNYTNDSDNNAVIVERTPMYIYRYDVLGYDGQDADPAAVVVTGIPEMAMISVEEYNSLAETYNSTHSDKLTLVDSSFGLGTPGNPLTYRQSFPNGKSNELFTMDGSSTLAYYGTGGSSEKTIGESSTLSNGYNVGIAFTSYAGGDLFGLGAKVSYTLGANQGTSFFHTDSTACTGSVGRQYEDGRFNFNWDMARWLNKGIPVVGYKVDIRNEDIINIPPVQPNGLDVADKGNNSVNLAWTNPPTTNGRIAANYIEVYYKKLSDTDYTMKRVLLQGTEGEKTWSLTNLDRNTSYQCYITNTYVNNTGYARASLPSDTINFTTADIPEYVDVIVNHGKGVELRSDSGKELQSVDAGAVPPHSIQNVLYNVKAGYQLPNNFYIASSNGISARAGTGVIEISGTPTANTTINIPDMTLTEYHIRYYDNGNIQSHDSYTVESDTITLGEISKDGYIFDGWKDDLNNIVTEIPSGSTGDKKLYAQWINLDILGYTPNYPADGSEQYPYIISSLKGWNFFCQCLENDKFDNFNGKHIKLGDNIIVSTMAGSEAHKFGGVFDGNNKTLTFNRTADSDYTAPFAYVEGTEDSPVIFKDLTVNSNITATDYQYTAGLVASQSGYTDIENCNVSVNLNTDKGTNNPSDLYSGGLVGKATGTLNITDCTATGTITTNGKFAGGFVAMTQANLTIKNCVSSVTIDSAVYGDGTHGGFIGIAGFNNHFEIEGCLFNGKLKGTTTVCCGGFVGYNSTYTRSSVTNSLFAPTELSLFSRYPGYVYNVGENFVLSGAVIDNCYYMTKLNGTQGKKAHSVTIGTAEITSDFGTAADTYSVSGITAYGTGLAYGGSFYAGEGERVPLTLNYTVPAGTGYHFDGYKTGSETLPYSDNILTMPNDDVVITAKNVANTYTVHFDPNVDYYYCGNTLRGSMEDQFFTYDEQAKALSANQYHVPTAEVTGWNTQADGSGTAYFDKQAVQNLTHEDNAEITLYAQWRRQKNIVYNPDIFECLVNGTVINSHWVYPGTTVQVRVIDNTAVYGDITIVDKDGNVVAFDTDTDTFTMPDQPVWINAASTKKMERTTIYLDDYYASDNVSYVYDENHQTFTPTVTVKNYDTDEVLRENVDYTLEITGNTGDPDKVVTATVTVTGIGNYIGTNTTEFRITPFNIADCDLKGSFNIPDDLDGYGIYYPLIESVEVWNGNTKLTAETDYYVEIAYCVVGQPYQATIKGNGIWGGIKTFEFTIIDGLTVAYVEDDNKIIPQTIPKCSNAPEYTPEKDGYTFMGWYLGDELYDFYNYVTEDITLTAHWLDSSLIKNIAVGTVFYTGDIVDFGDSYILYDDYFGTINDGNYGMVTIGNIEYQDGQYCITFEDGDSVIAFVTSAYIGEYVGVKVKDGTGTENDPFTFEIVMPDTKHTVTWLDADGNILEKDENVLFDTMPQFDSAMPADYEDNMYAYTYVWDKEITKVTGDVTYTLIRKKQPLSIGYATVCDGTDTNMYVPYDIYYNDAKYVNSQQIYPATMLSGLSGKDIWSLTFYSQSEKTQDVTDMKVYLAEVAETSFNGELMSLDNAVKVFEGDYQFSGTENVINFTQHYTYNGGNLLVVIMKDNQFGNTWTWERDFYGENQSSTTGYSYYSGTNSNPSSGSSSATFLAKCSFGYAQTCLSGAVITLDNNSFDYDGTEKTVTYTVTLDDKELTAGTDFTFEGDLTAADAGVYIVKVKGIGDYAGEAKTTWKIVPPDITVTVRGEPVEQNFEYNRSLTVTAPEAESGMKFSHWEVNGEAVSYSATYSFIVKESVDLVPVYIRDDDIVEQQAVLNLKTSQTTYNGKKAIKYTFTHSIPEGYTVKEVGLLYATNKLAGANTAVSGYATMNLTDSEAATALGVADVESAVKNNTSGKVKKYVASYKKLNGTVTFSYAIGTNTTAYTYAVGYVKVEKDGTEQTLYTNFVATDYSSANN